MFEANVKDVARAKDKEVHREALKAGYSVKLRGIPYRYLPDLSFKQLETHTPLLRIH